MTSAERQRVGGCGPTPRIFAEAFCEDAALTWSQAAKFRVFTPKTQDLAIKPTARAAFKPVGSGKLAVYMLRWVNSRGEPGPWSEVAQATVAA